MRLAAALVLAMACSSRAPAPQQPPDNRVHADPPIDAAALTAPVEAHVISVAIAGTDHIVTVDKGSEDGIDRRATAKIVINNGIVRDAILIRVDKKTSVLKANLTYEGDPKTIVVQFTPAPAILESPGTGLIDP
jgi:hypothetical protein